MEKLLLLHQGQEKIFGKINGYPEDIFDCLDLTYLIKPEANDGKIVFANFFNLKHSDHADINPKQFAKLLSENGCSFNVLDFMFPSDPDSELLRRCFLVC